MPDESVRSARVLPVQRLGMVGDGNSGSPLLVVIRSVLIGLVSPLPLAHAAAVSLSMQRAESAEKEARAGRKSGPETEGVHI